MAEKRYYWLKLKEDFFKDKAIKKLRKIAGGDTYTIIYLKMLLKAITQGNKLYWEGIEDTFADELALELDEDPENVKVTLSYVQRVGLIKVMNEEEFLLTQCEEMVGSETDAAKRKRLSRNRQKEALAKQQIGQLTDNHIRDEKTEKEEVQKKESTLQIFERLAPDFRISPILADKMREWMRYKMERKDNYKEQGMKALLKKVANSAEIYGDVPVCNLIDECMASNWKGIIWDKLESNKKDYVNRIDRRVSEVDNW